MDPINWPILGFQSGALPDFVSFWDKLYSGYDEDFYVRQIEIPVTDLTEDQIVDWFVWKNGKPLSAPKRQSIRQYFGTNERIPSDANTDLIVEFLKRPGGAIWRIFWLHVQHPNSFPIYDQHVHRAMAYLLRWTKLEIPNSNPKKVCIYLESYRPFFNTFAVADRRRLDRALWSFGQFLNTKYGYKLACSTQEV